MLNPWYWYLGLTESYDVASMFWQALKSGLVRALAASSGTRANEGAGPASAAEDSTSAEAAVRALAATVTLVLGDDANRHLARRADADGGPASAATSTCAREGGQEESLSPEVLAARLHRLASKGGSRRRRRGAEGGAGPNDNGGYGYADEEEEEVEDGDDEDGDGGGAPPQPPPRVPPPPPGDDVSVAHLKVERTRGWLRDTAPRVEGAVGAALAAVATHAKPSVRGAAGSAAADILQHCRGTLRGVSRQLLEIILALCGDPWPVVADPMRRRLRDLDAAGLLPARVIDSVIHDALGGLPAAVRRGGAQGRACAQKLVAALRAAGHGLPHVTRHVILRFEPSLLEWTGTVGL